MKNNLYYVPENLIKTNDASSKAREDIDTILKNNGLNPLLTMDSKVLNGKKSKLQFNFWQSLYSLYTVKIKNIWIILQYPYGGKIVKKAFEPLIKNNHLIFIVHDLEYLRFKNTKEDLYFEISLLNKADIIVSHNTVMTKQLQQDGVTVPVIDLELFDYLLDTAVPGNHIVGNQIVFAGNLEKSDFLKKEVIQDMNFTMKLYGPGFSETEMGWKNVHYAGSFKPEEVPYKLQGSFGLIWDGTSVDTCDGQTGAYMRYNNPHKLSLYIVSGLPVIVWKEAAVAEFVDNYQIGLTVNSLHEIADKIQGLTAEKYAEMVNNVKKLQGKLAEGYFTKEVLAKLDAIIESTKS